MSTRWGIYARLSYVRAGEEARSEAGLERQEDGCRALVAAKGGTVAETYADEGLSAYQPGVVRPSFERALNDLEAGHIDALAAWKLDRLCRSHEDISRLWQVIQQTGAALACVHDAVDTSTPAGEFMVRMTVSLARMESANLGLRVAAQREQAARAGRPGYGGSRPYGYEADKCTIVRMEAAVAQDAAARLLAGESLRSVARSLNAEEERTTTGKPWTPALLRQMLSRPRMVGKREHKGVIVGDADWPAILDLETWEQLRALFANPGRRSQVGRPRLFLLVGGLARCAAPGTQTIGDLEGVCGRPLISGRRSDRDRNDGDGRRYLCAPTTAGGCGGISVNRAHLEDLVTEAIAKALAGPGLAKALQATTGDVDATLAEQVAADEYALDELDHDYRVARIIKDRRLYLNRLHELQERIARNRRRLANLASKGALAALEHTDDAAAMRAQLDGLGLDRLRAVADVILEAVVVSPAGVASYGRGTRGGRRFDPDRVDYVWKI